MFDVGLNKSGAKIVLATSNDQRFPPEHIIDGQDDTFWTSTGLFPQEFIISLQSMMSINKVTLVCYNVKKISLEKSTSSEPGDFEAIAERDLSHTDMALQTEEITVPSSTRAQHLRVVITSAYDHFISINKLLIDGNAVHG